MNTSWTIPIEVRELAAKSRALQVEFTADWHVVSARARHGSAKSEVESLAAMKIAQEFADEVRRSGEMEWRDEEAGMKLRLRCHAMTGDALLRLLHDAYEMGHEAGRNAPKMLP